MDMTKKEKLFIARMSVYSKRGLWISIFLFLLTTFTHAQQIDILLKNGHVIDPANNINDNLDVAIANGRIVKVASGIPSDKAKKVIDATVFWICQLPVP